LNRTSISVRGFKAANIDDNIHTECVSVVVAFSVRNLLLLEGGERFTYSGPHETFPDNISDEKCAFM